MISRSRLPIVGRERRNDKGFTLVELLITMVIGPVVIGALVIMLLLIFHVQNSVTSRISGAVDAQVATANLVTDVQNAGQVTTSTTPSCGSTGTQLLGLSSDGGSTITSYVLVGTTNPQLVRFVCTNSNTTTPITRTLIAGSVYEANGTSGIVTVTTSSTGASSGWVSAETVSAVALNVTEPVTTNNSTSTSFALTTTPRAWEPPSNLSGGSPIPPITVLASNTDGCNANALSLGDNSGIQYTVGADQLVWGSTCSSSSTSSSSYWNDNSSSYSSWSNNWGQSTDYGQSSWSGGGGSSNVNDPLGGLNAPTYTNPTGSGSCTGTTCSSGTYTSSMTWTGNESFGSGTYVFTQPVTISGSANCTFGNGTYVFEGGITIQGNSNVNLGTGTFICGTSSTSTSTNTFNCGGQCSVTSGSGGSLIYCQGGCCNFSTTGSVNLCGKTSNQGVSIWSGCGSGQCGNSGSSSTPCVKLCGSTSGGSTSTTTPSNPCNYGTVYCPSGTVSCSSGKCNCSSVDCGSLCVQSGSTLCVG